MRLICAVCQTGPKERNYLQILAAPRSSGPGVCPPSSIGCDAIAEEVMLLVVLTG